MKHSLQTEITKKAVKLEMLAERVFRQPALLHEVFNGLGADKARTKYGCLKLLRTISEKRPDILYPEIGRLFRLLDNNSKIFKWGAIIIIGNLAAVDSDRKIDGILDRYLQPISGHVMITAANAIGGAGKIARAKPQLADRIARAVLRVETASYQTEECRNVAIGHAVKSLELFFLCLKEPQPVIEFVERQVNNRRNAVKRNAVRFLKKHKHVPPDAYSSSVRLLHPYKIPF